MTREKTDDWTSGSPATERSNRPLGRGLEDVSHLFLSNKANDRASDGVPGRPLDRAAPPAESRPRTLLLRGCPALTRGDVATMLEDVEGALEQGLRVIDRDLPCYPSDEIDLLAIDRVSQLVIVDFDTTSSDGLLLRSLSHFDWIVRNVPRLRRMYPGLAINFSAPPRLFLLVPQFSPVAGCAVRHLVGLQIVWFRYLVVEVGNGAGIFFERMADA